MFQRAKDVVIGDRGSLSGIQEFSNLGFCATLAAYAAAALAIGDPYRMTEEEVARVRALHLTAAVFNAMQPGVFALSGWDLTGSLLVGQKDLGSLLDDRDYRWMNRGAFDLMNVDPGAARSAGGLPRAKAIYGSMPEQLQDENSFVSHLKRLLRVRKEYGVAVSTLASVPETQSHGAVFMLLENADESGWVLAAVNFARESAQERVQLPELAGRSARLAYSTTGADGVRMDVSEQGEVSVVLGPIQADVFVVE
jgi:maltose alpha-D-glucosyltransferase/alpha-amylase